MTKLETLVAAYRRAKFESDTTAVEYREARDRAAEALTVQDVSYRKMVDARDAIWLEIER